MFKLLLKLLFKPPKMLISLVLGAVKLPTERADEQTGDKHNGFSLGLYYPIEDNTEDQQSVQDWFESHGQALPELPGGAGGLLITRGRTVIDMGGGGATNEEKRAIGDPELGYGQGQMSLGHIIFQNRFLRIYPLAGIGGTGGDLKTEPGDDGQEPVECGMGAFAITSGLGIDFMLRIWHFGMMVGLRFGTRYGVGSVRRGPGQAGAPVSGPFFRVIVGPRFGR